MEITNVAEVTHRYKKGESVSNIAKDLGIKAHQIYHILHRESVPIRPVKKKVKLEKLQKGESMEKMARRLNVSRSTIYRRLNGRSIFQATAQDMYEEGYSLETIAEKMGLTIEKIKKYLKEDVCHSEC